MKAGLSFHQEQNAAMNTEFESTDEVQGTGAIDLLSAKFIIKGARILYDFILPRDEVYLITVRPLLSPLRYPLADE